MVFKRMVLVGINPSQFDPAFYKQLNDLALEKTLVGKDETGRLAWELKSADGLLVDFGVRIGAEEIDAAPGLKYIGVLATSFGKIDVGYAKKRGIVVANLPGYSTESVAEFVFAALLENCRALALAKKQACDGNYSQAGFSAIELRGKKFGVVGLGRIGSRVAQIAQGFGAQVSYWSRNRKPGPETQGVTYLPFDELVSSCDFISICIAYAPETENLFGQREFEKITPGAVVINTSPMELVNLGALENRLKKGDLTFISDHSDEMAAEDLKRLSNYANWVVYPPIAYVSTEARNSKQEMFIANIENFLKGTPTNAV